MESRVTDRIHGDRRTHRRYQIDLNLSFRQISGKRGIGEGTGRLADISSGGLLFETTVTVPLGSNIEVAVCWPYCNDSGQQLKLVVVGRTVRVAQGRVAVQTVRHSFQATDKAPRRPVTAISATSSPLRH
jgi:hypothetical protein